MCVGVSACFINPHTLGKNEHAVLDLFYPCLLSTRRRAL